MSEPVSETDKLLPCPFCGALGEMIETHRSHFVVRCTNDDCRVQPMPRLSPIAAREAWNERGNP